MRRAAMFIGLVKKLPKRGAAYGRFRALTIDQFRDVSSVHRI